MTDDHRRLILARRARFVAAALAGAGLGAGVDGCGPKYACLSPPGEVPIPAAEAGAEPPEDTDAALPPRADPSTTPEEEAPPEQHPRVCLSEF